MHFAERYSQFPSDIDSFIEHYDISYADLANVRRYEELMTKSSLTEVEQRELSDLTVTLRNKLWTAEDLNKVTSSLVNLQTYFRNNTTVQLDTWKNEIIQFNNDYQVLSQQISQSWTTTSATTYDIHSGNDTLEATIELKLDTTSSLTVIVDGAIIPYDKYEVRDNASAKKTIIAFIGGYVPAVGKRMEARWTYTSKEMIVSNHQHSKNDVVDLPNVAKSGKYGDLTEIPTSFPPSTHRHKWGEVDEKPVAFPPSAHTHDDRYYTESEINTKLAGKSDSGHKHAIADVNGLQGQIDSLKSSVSSGKAQVANAITGKGVPTSTSAEFATMASNIGKISSIPKFYKHSTYSYTTTGQEITLNGFSGYVQIGQTVNYADASGRIDVVSDGKTNSFYAGFGSKNYPRKSRMFFFQSSVTIRVTSSSNANFYVSVYRCDKDFTVENKRSSSRHISEGYTTSIVATETFGDKPTFIYFKDISSDTTANGFIAAYYPQGGWTGSVNYGEEVPIGAVICYANTDFSVYANAYRSSSDSSGRSVTLSYDKMVIK